MRATTLDLYSKRRFSLYFSLLLCSWRKQTFSSSLAYCEFFQELLPQDQSCHYSHKATFDNSLFVAVKAEIPRLDASPSHIVLLAYKTPQRWYFCVMAGLYWRCYDNQIAWELWTSSKQPKESGFGLVYHRRFWNLLTPRSVISGPGLAQ